MPHAYEIYIEKETETSFRDFCTHTKVLILYTCHMFYPPHILFDSLDLLEIKKSGCAEESEPKMWIKLFSEYIHIHTHLYYMKNVIHETRVRFGMHGATRKRINFLYCRIHFFLPVR